MTFVSYHLLYQLTKLKPQFTRHSLEALAWLTSIHLFVWLTVSSINILKKVPLCAGRYHYWLQRLWTSWITQITADDRFMRTQPSIYTYVHYSRYTWLSDNRLNKICSCQQCTIWLDRCLQLSWCLCIGNGLCLFICLSPCLFVSLSVPEKLSPCVFLNAVLLLCTL